MGAGTSGTLRKVTLDGTTYAVPADLNVKINYSPFKTEGIATTGDTMYKMTLRLQDIEDVVLVTKPTEANALLTLASRLTDFPISLELADGTVLRGQGRIDYDKWETQENKSSIKIIPNKTRNAWKPFNP
jgi:hypothetical protein